MLSSDVLQFLYLMKWKHDDFVSLSEWNNFYKGHNLYDSLFQIDAKFLQI